MKLTVVDYESFFSKKDGISTAIQGVDNYVASTDAYIVSIVSDEFEWCGTIDQTRQQFGDSFWSDPENQFFAANSNFDFGWHNKYFAPTAHPWQCVLDMGVGNQLPRDLANLARVALGVRVDKSIRDSMDGVRWEDLPEDKQQAMIEYCLNDSIQEFKLLKALPPLTPIETEIAAHTRLVNRRGVHIDVDRVEADKTMLEKIKHTSFRKIPWRGDCGVHGEGLLSAKKLAKWCEANNIPVPKSLDKRSQDCSDLMADHPALNAVILEMRKFRTANTLIEKAATLDLRLTTDHRLPLDLLYCGAPHTRRWSSQGWNIQNLAKEPFFGDIVLDDKGKPDMEKSEWVWLREWLIPAPGKKFLIFDFSQIEPRCLNWLVGNEEMLSMIRAGYGIYEAYAVAFKNYKGGPGTLKKANPLLYACCKAEVLGLGYGMGAAKYRGEAKKSGVDLAALAQESPEYRMRETQEKIAAMTEEQRIDYLEQLGSQYAVTQFRTNNPRIPSMWRNLDRVMKQAILTPDKLLQIEMPTGDFLRHFHIRTDSKINDEGETRASYLSSKMRGVFDERGIVRNLWGGTLTENVTQRMGRDIMAEAILRVEKAGFPVRFHCHDELIMEVDNGSEKFLADTKADVERMLTQPPEWAPDIPLAVEGSYEERYTK